MVRSWLVFFGPTAPPWSWVTRRGFGHVMAAGYDLELDTWIFYNPSREATLITLHRPGVECDRLLGLWAYACSPHILRVRPGTARSLSPPMFSCVGAIKALLGVRSRALGPRAFFNHLLADGAEIVPVPKPEADIVVSSTGHSGASPGGPGGHQDATSGAEAGGSRQASGNAGATNRRDIAA